MSVEGGVGIYTWKQWNIYLVARSIGSVMGVFFLITSFFSNVKNFWFYITVFVKNKYIYIFYPLSSLPELKIVYKKCVLCVSNNVQGLPN